MRELADIRGRIPRLAIGSGISLVETPAYSNQLAVLVAIYLVAAQAYNCGQKVEFYDVFWPLGILSVYPESQLRPFHA